MKYLIICKMKFNFHKTSFYKLKSVNATVIIEFLPLDVLQQSLSLIIKFVS